MPASALDHSDGAQLDHLVTDAHRLARLHHLVHILQLQAMVGVVVESCDPALRTSDKKGRQACCSDVAGQTSRCMRLGHLVGLGRLLGRQVLGAHPHRDALGLQRAQYLLRPGKKRGIVSFGRALEGWHGCWGALTRLHISCSRNWLVFARLQWQRPPPAHLGVYLLERLAAAQGPPRTVAGAAKALAHRLFCASQNIGGGAHGSPNQDGLPNLLQGSKG